MPEEIVSGEKLSVLERLKLLDFLPVTGDITTLRIVRQLREDLSFSEEEHSELEFKTSGDTVHWNPLADQGKTISLGPKAREVIALALKRASEAQKLGLDCVTLYDRFVEE